MSTGSGPADARAEILGRIRDALGDPRPPAERIPRDYSSGAADLDGDALAALLCARIRDYAAEASRISAGDDGDDGAAPVGRAVAAACRRFGVGRLAVAPGVPAAWRPGAGGGVEVREDDGLSVAAIDEIDAVLTGCAVAIAETGTVVLDGGPSSGRRVLSLVPDHHICVVRAAQIVASVPGAIAALAPAVRERRAPITFISGSSATSDIELERVEGVHGPRRLLVLIVD